MTNSDAVPPTSAPAATAEPESRESLITDALHDSYYRALGNDGRWYCFTWNEGADFICAFPEGASETTEALATFGDDADEAAPEIIRWLESRPAAHSGEKAETKLTEEDRDVLHRLAEMHPEYSVRLRAIAYHYPMVRKMVEDSASDLAAQATELAALRARVWNLAHDAIGAAYSEGATDADPTASKARRDRVATRARETEQALRAALAPRQTTGDEHG